MTGKMPVIAVLHLDEIFSIFNTCKNPVFKNPKIVMLLTKTK